nr:hypothetical protein [Pseudonocardia pini]
MATPTRLFESTTPLPRSTEYRSFTENEAYRYCTSSACSISEASRSSRTSSR